MKNHKNIIPQENIERLETQGFTGFSAKELSDHRMGIRFAYWLCASFVILGLVLSNIPILIFAMLMALGGAIHSRHPFDYVYNATVRHLLNKPKTPRRAIQGNIACGIATLMILTVIILFYNDYMTAGYIVGTMLLSSALLVGSTDICIPSIVYKILMKRKLRSF